MWTGFLCPSTLPSPLLLCRLLRNLWVH